MLTEECGLNPYLTARGVEVVDTDLGERIVQLRGEAPSHIVMPAIHLKREDVGDTFHEHLGTPAGLADPQALTEAARRFEPEFGACSAHSRNRGAWCGTSCWRTPRAAIWFDSRVEARVAPVAESADAAGSSPVIEHPPVHQTHRCHLSATFHSPGQPNHSTPAHPLQHALSALHPSDYFAVPALQSVLPISQLRRIHLPGQRHYPGQAVDGRHPDVYPRLTLSFGQRSPALRNPAIGPGLPAAQRAAAIPNPKIQLFQASARAKPQEFEGGGVAARLHGGSTALGWQEHETCKHNRAQRRYHALRPWTR